MYMRQNLIRPASPILIYITGGRRAIARVPRVTRFRGVGDLPPQANTIAGIAASGAQATTATLVALGTISGPVGAAIMGLVTLGVGIAKLFGGCGQVCTATADIANQVEPILAQNLNQYMSSPVRYRSMQVAALNNYDTAWAAFRQNELGYGQQGQTSITERDQGGCHWHVAPFGWTQNSDGSWSYHNAGPDGSGTTCWNWRVAYRDPIANDPNVQPDPLPTSQAASAVVSALGLNPSTTVAGIPASDLLLPAALVLAGLIL